MDLAKRYF